MCIHEFTTYYVDERKRWIAITSGMLSGPCSERCQFCHNICIADSSTGGLLQSWYTHHYVSDEHIR